MPVYFSKTFMNFQRRALWSIPFTVAWNAGLGRIDRRSLRFLAYRYFNGKFLGGRRPWTSSCWTIFGWCSDGSSEKCQNVASSNFTWFSRMADSSVKFLWLVASLPEAFLGDSRLRTLAALQRIQLGGSRDSESTSSGLCALTST